LPCGAHRWLPAYSITSSLPSRRLFACYSLRCADHAVHSGHCEGVEEISGRTILNNVYGMVEQTHLYLENYCQSIVMERKLMLRNVIALVEAHAQMLDKQVRTSKLSREHAKRTLLDELRHIKHGGPAAAQESMAHAHCHVVADRDRPVALANILAVIKKPAVAKLHR